MKYYEGLELICIKSLKRKSGEINFFKGKTYVVKDVYQKQLSPSYSPIYIRLINEQGLPQSLGGRKKTKFFKIPKSVEIITH